MSKKLIAWGGGSKLLHMYLLNTKENPFSYCVDSFSKEQKIGPLKIVRPNALTSEDKDSILVVVFAVANSALRDISSFLAQIGLSYQQNFIYYSDFFWETFCESFLKKMGWRPSIDIYRYALSFTLNSVTPIHTTVLGTVAFLECLEKIQEIDGDIAEVGAFEGGNALCSLIYSTSKNISKKKYWIFDSFEGFPELSEYDPSSKQQGDYNTETSVQQICNNFKIFPEGKIIQGFVPQTYEKVPKDSKFAIVFYDCDLYQPALDTYNYFWERIVSGGYLIIHDYETEPGGFEGVRKATHEFFQEKDVSILTFYENTMAIIKKQ